MELLFQIGFTVLLMACIPLFLETAYKYYEGNNLDPKVTKKEDMTLRVLGGSSFVVLTILDIGMICGIWEGIVDVLWLFKF
jgi:hypothetical protein